jgi:copper homeostasis protein
MVRTRPGPFVLDDRDREAERRHAAAMLDAGADGIVFGGLSSDGRVDLDAAERLATLASGRQAVFHRAIDLALDWENALRQLATHGITRVLTAAETPSRAAASLGLAAAEAPADTELEERWARFGSMGTLTGGRPELIAGGGVRASNAAGWIRRAGAVQLHSSGRVRGGNSLDVVELRKLREAVNAAQDAGC